MPEGPLGNISVDGPFGESTRLLLKFDIAVKGQSPESYNTPQNINGLVDAIANSSMYMERDITVFRSDAPKSGPDFIAVVDTNPGEYWSVIDGNVESIENAINERRMIEVVGVIPVCGKVDEIIKDNTSKSII